MVNLIAISVIVCVGLQVSAVDSYNYYFKVTQTFADMVENMAEQVKGAQQEMNKVIKEKCSFTKAVQAYQQLILKAQGGPCDRSYEAATLQAYQDTFQTSRASCEKEAGCKDDMPAIKDQLIKDIQTTDQTALAAVFQCADDDCKMKVYQNTQDELANLYTKSIPALRLAEDRVLTKTDCSKKIIECVISANQDNLKSIYNGIATLETCLEQAQQNTEYLYNF